jgi:thiosulfate dehydrogenase [quinone] large subunit
MISASTQGLRSLRTRPEMALFPLRIFLGITFVYAGIQKLSDPGFLHPGAATYIGTQLHGFANGTPGGFLLRTFAIPHAELAGIGVALLEILVGLLVLVGLFTRAAATVGLGLNLVLFLTASWKTSPYFLGPDIVFVFAWLPFVLAGADGQPALSHAIESRLGQGLRRRGPVTTRSAADPGAAVTRGQLFGQALGAVGAATLGIAGISALAKGSYHDPRQLLGAQGARGTAARTRTTAHKTRAANTPKVPSGAVRLGPADRLPPGQGATYSDPADGSPDLLIRQANGELTAMSAVCTHAGCTVGYENGQVVCPCHGATYDSRSGAVTGGPAPQGLARKRVVESGGQIYAVPS